METIYYQAVDAMITLTQCAAFAGLTAHEFVLGVSPSAKHQLLLSSYLVHLGRAKQRSATSLSPICAFSSILEHRDEQQTFWSCCDYSCLIIRMPDVFHLGGRAGTSCQNPPPPGVLRQGEMRNPSQFGDRRPLMKRVAQKNRPRLGARVAYAGIDLRGRSSKMG
jgi:hypothetical protein